MPSNRASDNQTQQRMGVGVSELEPFLSFYVQVKPSFLGNLALNNKSLENEKKILKMEADIVEEGTPCKQSNYCRDSIYKPGANRPVRVQTCKRGIFLH